MREGVEPETVVSGDVDQQLLAVLKVSLPFELKHIYKRPVVAQGHKRVTNIINASAVLSWIPTC